jgi:hypothetical protein
MKNKKNKLTNIFKIGILLIGFSLFLSNCEKDNEINEFYNVSINNKLDYTLEKIGYFELITDQEIKKSLPKIKQIFSKSKKRKTQSKKTTQISEHFTIITDSIHKIITKDVITWAFKIETPVLKSSDFENFLVKKYNEEFSYFLVSYEKDLETKYKKAILYPISKESLNLDDLNLASRGDYLMADDTQGGGDGCSGKPVYGQCSVGGEANGHGPALQWDGVTKCSGSPLLYFDFTHCRNGGSLGLDDIPDYNPSDSDNTQNGDSGMSNSGGGSSSNGDTVITNPVTLECDNCSNSQSLISYLNLTDLAQINWVNDTSHNLAVTNLSNFGDVNQWSDSVTTITQQIISAFSNTNNLNLSFEENIAIKNKATEIFDIIAKNNFSNIDQYSIADQKTITQNSLFISFLPNLKDLGIELPQTAEEWAEFGEFLITVLKELIPELIPGVSELNSLKNSISAFSNGSYTDASTELAFAIVGVFPVGKAWKIAAKAFKGMKIVVRLSKAFKNAKKMRNLISSNFNNALASFNQIGTAGSQGVRQITNSSKEHGKTFFELLTKNIPKQTIQGTNGPIIKATFPNGSKIQFRDWATNSDGVGNKATIEFLGGDYTSLTKKIKFNE